jgi:hypothetical protein
LIQLVTPEDRELGDIEEAEKAPSLHSRSLSMPLKRDSFNSQSNGSGSGGDMERKTHIRLASVNLNDSGSKLSLPISDLNIIGILVLALLAFCSSDTDHRR